MGSAGEGTDADRSSKPDSESSSEKAAPVTKKRPYEAPVLQDWGTLQDVTQAVGNHGKADGGRPPFKNTR